jgi:hypothetical protein
MYGNLDPIEYHAERVAIILVGLIASGKVRPLLFRVCVYFASCSAPFAQTHERRSLTRLRTADMTHPYSLHSQKPSRNASRRSGGATRMSLVIVAKSRT